MPESGKKLIELKVCDLKDELEKRKLETIGSKSALIERLQTALKNEGHDPNTHQFQLKAKKIVSPMKMQKVQIKEEPVDLENAVAEDDANGSYQRTEDDHLVDEIGTVDDECVIIEDDDEYYANGEDQEALEEEGGDEAEIEDEENAGDGNNPDNEESINLTIGEEEQKLLHDEADDKDKSTTVERVKAVRKEGEEKVTGKENKSENHNTDANNETMEDDGSKNKSKNDEKAGDKKDNSEQKSSTKTSHKEDKGLFNLVMIL